MGIRLIFLNKIDSDNFNNSYKIEELSKVISY